MLHRFSVYRHAVSYTPADSLGPIARGPAYSSRYPGRQRRRPSPRQRWVGVRDKTFGASSDVHLRYGLPARGTAERSFSSKAPTASLPPPPLRLLPAGANQLPGGSYTTEDLHLFTAHYVPFYARPIAGPLSRHRRRSTASITLVKRPAAERPGSLNMDWKSGCGTSNP